MPFCQAVAVGWACSDRAESQSESWEMMGGGGAATLFTCRNTDP